MYGDRIRDTVLSSGNLASWSWGDFLVKMKKERGKESRKKDIEMKI